MIDAEIIKALVPSGGVVLSPGYKYLGSLASNPGTYRSVVWSLRTFLRLHLGPRGWAQLISKQPPVENGRPRSADLREVFACCAYGWQDLDRESFLGVRDALRAEGFADTVVLKVLTAARGPVRRAAAMGLPTHDIELLPGERPRVKTKRTGVYLTQDDITEWLRACVWLATTARQPLYWTRAACCFALQLGAGLRSAEVLKLDVRHLDADGRWLTIKAAKGGDGRARFRGDFRPALEWVRWWLDERGTERGPLVCGISREPVPVPVPSRGIGYQSMEEAYHEVARVAKVHAFASHDLRRTLATDTIAQRGLRNAQVALRHKSADTTTVYDLSDYDDDDGDEPVPGLRFPNLAEVFASVEPDSFRVRYRRRWR